MSRPARVLIPIVIAAALGSSLVSAHYYRLGRTLSHYDPRGHLVVAPRVFDSLAPGWQQLGARVASAAPPAEPPARPD